MNTTFLIPSINRSDKRRAESSPLLGKKNLGLKVFAGAILAIPFALIAFTMAQVILAGL